MDQASRNLDLLRAFAVLAVLTNHLIGDVFHLGGQFLSALGHAGVFIFFVHTCVVLLRSLDRTVAGHLFRDFYVRRTFRIYPLSIASILIVMLFRIPDMPLHQFQRIGLGEAIANFTLTQNINNGHSILGPLWSLPWEIQMYATLPFVWLILKRWGSPQIAVCMWVGFVALRYALLIAHLPAIAYYLAYFPCFLGGAVAYQATKAWTPRLEFAIWPLAIVSLCGLDSWVWSAPTTVCGIPIRQLTGYLLCFALGILLPLCKEFPPTWFTVGSHVVAKYSYGIYLFHVPIIWLAFVKLSMLWFPTQLSVFAILMLLVPWIAFRCIEDPCIQLGRRITRAVTRPAECA